MEVSSNFLIASKNMLCSSKSGIRRLVIITVVGFSAICSAGEKIFMRSGTLESGKGFLSSNLLQSSEQSNELIVQFKSPISAMDKKMISDLGGEILGYLPDDALVVRGVSAHQLARNEIQQVIPYFADLKISPDMPALSIFNKGIFQRIIVDLFKANELFDVIEKLKSIPSTRVLAADGKSMIVETDAANIRQIANISGVEHIQNVVKFETFDFDPKDGDLGVKPTAGDYKDLDGSESGTRVMKFESMWSSGYKGQGQVASMADTGLDTGDLSKIHTDFSGAILEGQFFGSGSKSWNDPMGHGTHVAGSIVGRGTASGGVLKGGAHEAKFVGQSIWSPIMEGLSLPSKLSTLFDAAKKRGASVHSNSWGSAANLGGYDSFSRQVDEWMFNNPDVLVLFAAGNSGVDANRDGRIDPGSVSSPGTAKNALTVGASENKTATGGIQKMIKELSSAKDKWSAEPILSSKISDNENGIAMFSSRGPTSDGRIKPEIVAPGTNILSTASHVSGSSEMWGRYNSEYIWAGGTSMATPLTAGAASITRQYIIKNYNITTPSAALIKAVLMNSAKELYPGQYGMVGEKNGQEILTKRPDSNEGFGRVDMEAVSKLKATTNLADEKDGVAKGEEKIYPVEIKAGEALTVNLVYTDAPASANASKTLVNDLDLELRSVTSKKMIKAINDRVNNNEFLNLENLAAGRYELVVKGYNVPSAKNGKQPFAIVWSKSAVAKKM